MSDQTNSEQELAASIQDGIARNFAQGQVPQAQPDQPNIQSDRLKDLEKKLPDWNLEPPSSFLGE